MKSTPSQLFFIPFHRVLPRLDAWFLNPRGEEEKIKIKTRKWWYLKREFIFLQTGARFPNKSHCIVSCAFSLTTTSLCFSKCLLKNCLCHKHCKGLDNIYTAGWAGSRDLNPAKVKQHNCLPFVPINVGNWGWGSGGWGGNYLHFSAICQYNLAYMKCKRPRNSDV